jgi:predicted Na+-dependent transporter
MMGRMVRLLEALGQRGSEILAIGIFGGLLIPPLAHLLRFVILPEVLALMTLVLLRIDLAAVVGHLKRPGRLALLLLFHLVLSPLIVRLLILPLPLDDGIAAGLVVFATGAGALSAPAFARLVGLDPELSLLMTLGSTFLLPFTAPPLAFALTGVDLALTPLALMERLALVVGLPTLASLLIRRQAGPTRLARAGKAVDGGVVLLLTLYGLGVMDGLTARLFADPLWVGAASLAAFAADFGLNLLTTLAFLWMGRREALSAGLVSGNRNMALYLAVLPHAADPRIALFFALCQFPLYLSPALLRPLYRRLEPPAALASLREYGRWHRSNRAG